MKKIVFTLLVVLVGFASCNKDPQPLTKQQIKQKVDSISVVRMKEQDDLSRIDLERRIKIEVKVKVDSILNARLMLQIKNDSILTAKQNSKAKDTVTANKLSTK